jgi:phosphoglycolate phosphatase
MTTPLRLVLFDVDGTLVDSQGAIVGAMNEAFRMVDLPAPDRPDVLSIVGLSLPKAMAVLAPQESQGKQAELVEAYKEAYHAARLLAGAGHSPLYPGAREMLEHLHAQPETLLGVATGKSRRGMDALIEAHGLHFFLTVQVADNHPSKPHPSMVLTAMSETGVTPENTVVIGDTRFDMDMARAAGVNCVGVSWGYHSRDSLNADYHIDVFEELPGVLNRIWKVES